MKCIIELDTERYHEVAVTANGERYELSRDAYMNWRQNGLWVANSNATALDAARCLIRNLTPPHQR